MCPTPAASRMYEVISSSQFCGTYDERGAEMRVSSENSRCFLSGFGRNQSGLVQLATHSNVRGTPRVVRDSEVPLAHFVGNKTPSSGSEPVKVLVVYLRSYVKSAFRSPFEFKQKICVRAISSRYELFKFRTGSDKACF